MAWQGRKYELSKSENFEEYMKALGVGFVLRKVGNSVSPTVFLEKNGDEYAFHTVSTFKTTVLKFQLGVEKNQDTLDGASVPTTFTLEGDTLTQIEKRDKPSKIVRKFGETELYVECEYDGVVSKRWYKVEA